MRLSDIDIKKAMETGDITLSDFDENRLQPASYDLLLGYSFLVFDRESVTCLDPKEDISRHMKRVVLKDENEAFILHPQEFALGVTYDRVGVSNKYSCELMGKSSLARLGLIVHTTGGFIDPGNELNITLEFYNTNSVAIKLYPKMKIGQVAFSKLLTPSEKSYGDKKLGSKYYGANDVQASAMHENYKKD